MNSQIVHPGLGTVSEKIEAIELCRRAGWAFVISHRSGETEDTFLADFAVAMGGGQIKTGSVCRSERIAKYNRMLEIQGDFGKAAFFENPLRIGVFFDARYCRKSTSDLPRRNTGPISSTKP
jgi:enolase